MDVDNAKVRLCDHLLKIVSPVDLAETVVMLITKVQPTLDQSRVMGSSLDASAQKARLEIPGILRRRLPIVRLGRLQDEIRVRKIRSAPMQTDASRAPSCSVLAS